jgi:hypothetical protein
MPIAKFEMPDGRIAKFEVPEGTTPEQAQQVFAEFSAGQQQAPKQRTWGDVPLEALSNLPASVGGVVKGVGEAIASPIETAKGLYKVGKGAVQNVTGLGDDREAQQAASAVGDFYKQRYGSEEGFKQALATDPAGVLADASTVLTGGAGMAAKVPMLAKGAAVAGKVGASIDPLVAALRGGQAAVSGAGSVAKQVLGKTTGVGSEAIGEAYKAGKAGNTAFTENMRGNAPMTDVLDTAKADLEAMNRAKQAEYRSGMVDIKNDKSVLDLSGVDSAIQKAFDRVSFKGQIKDQYAAEAASKAREMVDNWKNLDPAEYHTPEGLDALKQQVGSVLESIPLEQKNARAIVGDVYNSIKSEINTQAPTYSKVMKDYATASEQIKEIERALSLGQKASADTAMRKLQSLMRNNVNTNYGNRLNLAKALEQAGGQEIMPALAGQAMSDWTPRGLQGAAVAPTSMVAYGAGGIPLAVGNAASSSPRLVGEAAYGAGQIAGGLRKLGNRVPNSPVDPRILANALYQANQMKGQQ